MMPYHADALLPTAERYASLKFRRVAQRIEYRLLSYEDAVELIAFVETIGYENARYIFHWKPGRAYVRAYGRFRRRLDGDQVQACIHANMTHMGMDDGLAILRAMRDGGWRRGKLPWITKMALKELRKSHTIAEIVRQTGLTRDQVRNAVDDRRVDRKSERAAAVSSLAVG